MTGMKEGAGEDPFAEDSTSTESTSADRSQAEETATSSDRMSDRDDIDTRDTQTSTTEKQAMQIPYKFRRDGVQEGRDRVPLFLHEKTKRAEREALRELEERFDADVSLTDLREALVKVGLQDLDAVERNLEEWGYGMTFNE